MAVLPLSRTVEASSAKRSLGRSALSLLASTFVQGLALALLVVVPLLAMQALPEPASRWAMPSYLPVVPTPPPAPRASAHPARASKELRPPSPEALRDLRVPPLDLVDALPDAPLFEDGVEGGGPPGVVGGVGTPSDVALAPAPPSEPPSGPVRPGGDVRYPRKIRHVRPRYPRLAREAGIEGVVRLETTIDAEGNVVNLRVLDSVALLDAAAIEAVRQWKYEPTLLNGTPVPVLLTVEVVFQLAR